MATVQSQENQLTLKIARILDEVRTTQATHLRKLKELSTFRSSHPTAEFSATFCKALAPIFKFQRRTASTVRVVNFISVFACSRFGKGDSRDEFLESLMRFLLMAASSADKTVRFRACQVASEIIMRLPDDAEVSNELWDDVIECMKVRVSDKVAVVRTFAVRALSRFVNDSENRDILELLLEKLSVEHNGDVRKIILLSLPPSTETLSVVIDCTLDVSDSVRKATYSVLASKFPLQSLSIKLRTTILQRGLTDRSTAVAKECLKLLKDEWLQKCCNGDPVELLKFLDVETYESVGESVMTTLLREGLVNLQHGQTIRTYIVSNDHSSEGDNNEYKLMDGEVALFWKMVCKHLQNEAHSKGSDAATTLGAESTLYAAEASDNNDLLDNVLPAAVSDYVELVKAHIAAGSNYRFASRQLLLLGATLDFSDSTNRKVANEFIQQLLHMPIDHELDDNGDEVVIGDGFSLGGERDWATAVAELTNKVHAAKGEFEEVVLSVLEELAKPCRERTADCKQWLHCLAVTALLLEHTSSFRHMRGRSIEPDEILNSLLLPGAKHANLDVQRASIRCLGLFGLRETKPAENLVKQLRYSFIKGPHGVALMASKSLLDLGVWHGPDEVDKAMNCSLSSQLHDNVTSINPVDIFNESDEKASGLLHLLYAGIGHEWESSIADEESQSIQGILGEGLAKILLLSNKFPGSYASSHHLLLTKLTWMYFSHESQELHRLKQCLSVFFEHYPALSANHKKCISKAFLPVLRSLWPGISGNAAGSTLMVSNMRNRAVQASQFMLQMMQVPLFATADSKSDNNELKNSDDVTALSADYESGEEGLAIRIAVEVASFNGKKTAAERSYVAALGKILAQFQFRVSEQDPVKLMLIILNRALVSAASEKDLLKDLRQVVNRLQSIILHPDEGLPADTIDLILGRLELEIDLENEDNIEIPPTPAPEPTRRRRKTTRVDEESSSDDETSPTSVVPSSSKAIGTRSQRASKTAAMSKMANKTTVRIDEEDSGDTDAEEENSEEDSDVTEDEDY